MSTLTSFTVPPQLVEHCTKLKNWDPSKQQASVKAYRQFMDLKKQLEDWSGSILLPPSDVEFLWKQHMMMPQSYYTCCQQFCGAIIDRPLRGDEPAARFQRMATTKVAVKARFGLMHFDPSIWNVYQKDNEGQSTVQERTADLEPDGASNEATSMGTGNNKDDMQELAAHVQDIVAQQMDRNGHSKTAVEVPNNDSSSAATAEQAGPSNKRGTPDSSRATRSKGTDNMQRQVSPDAGSAWKIRVATKEFPPAYTSKMKELAKVWRSLSGHEKRVNKTKLKQQFHFVDANGNDMDNAYFNKKIHNSIYYYQKRSAPAPDTATSKSEPATDRNVRPRLDDMSEEPILFYIVESSGEKTQFQVQPSTKMGNFFSFFLKHKGIRADGHDDSGCVARFTMDGVAVSPYATAISLNLDKRKLVHFAMVQAGNE